MSSFCVSCRTVSFRLCHYALSVSFSQFSLLFFCKCSFGERQLCCQSCRFQRQAIPSTECRKQHSSGQWLPPLTCTRKLHSLYPCTKGLRPLYSPSASANAYAVFAKFSAKNFCKKVADFRYAFTESFSITGCFACPASYLILPTKKQRRFYVATAQNILVEMFHIIPTNWKSHFFTLNNKKSGL